MLRLPKSSQMSSTMNMITLKECIGEKNPMGSHKDLEYWRTTKGGLKLNGRMELIMEEHLLSSRITTHSIASTQKARHMGDISHFTRMERSKSTIVEMGSKTENIGSIVQMAHLKKKESMKMGLGSGVRKNESS